MLASIGTAALLGLTLVGAKRVVLDQRSTPQQILNNETETLIHRTATHSSNVVQGMYLVEFSDGHDNASFFTSLHASGIFPILRMHLNHTLFKGASFRIDDSVVQEHNQVSMISVLPAVKQMWPLRNYTIPRVQRRNTMRNPKSTITRLDDSTPADEDIKHKRKDTFSTHVMTQVDKLHAEGNTGKGIRIGIVDTGVDYTHPALGGCFGKPHCLISYGYDLVGKLWDGVAAPKPDHDPFDDCIGHGTHVSGIIAAQSNKMNFTGVAPGAKLGMYKVFSCYTMGTTDDVLISAFNMAYEDGSDIITASIGGQVGWSEQPWSVAVSRIVDAGVPCTVAAGNAGGVGLFGSSDAANGVGVTAVASFDNSVTPNLLPTAFYKVSGQGSPADDADASKGTAFAWMPSYPEFHNVSLPLWALSNNSGAVADACTKLPDDTPDLSKYAVLIRLGGCDAMQKVKHALAKNIAKIVFYADESSGLPELDLWDRYQIDQALNASGTVTAAMGAAWIESLNNGADVELTFVDPFSADVAYVEVPNNVTGGFASYFTSWGPTWDLAIYPTVGAPGGNILSTYPVNYGSYAVLSGTSMATPFTAAVYALLAQIRKRSDTPLELVNLVSSTAKANFWNDGGGSLRDLAPVPQQGPGLMQAFDAAYATTLVSRAGISFNDSDHNPGAVEFTISNEGDDTTTYKLGHMPALGMYMLGMSSEGLTTAYFPNPIFASSAGVNFSETTIDLKPKARAMISVTPLPPTSDYQTLREQELPVYSGYISINGSDGSNLTIPYMGVAGSMYSTQNVNPGSTNLGCGGDGVGSGFVYEPSYCSTYNASFTLPYPTRPLRETNFWDMYMEYPQVRVFLNMGSALIRADVVPMSHNYSGPTTMTVGRKTVGSIYGYPRTYIDRTEYTAPAFNGMLADGSVVPEGYRYGLLVRVLKLFGDPEVDDDYSYIPVVPFMLHYDNSSFSGYPPTQKGMPLLG